MILTLPYVRRCDCCRHWGAAPIKAEGDLYRYCQVKLSAKDDFPVTAATEFCKWYVSERARLRKERR